MDSCLHQLNWLHKLDARVKEFIGRIYLDKRMQQRQYGCRVNQNHQNHQHRQENKPENTQDYSNRHQAAAVHHKTESRASLTTTRILPPLPLSSSSCFPLLSLESPLTPR